MPGFAYNPRSANLWSENVVLSGRSRRHRVEPMEGTLSIKTTVDGQGWWRTPAGSYKVSPETYLILNHGQTYELDIASPSAVQTFCVFFRPGFIEDVARTHGLRGGIGFYERLRLMPGDLRAPLNALRILALEGAREPSSQLRRPSPYGHEPSDKERERDGDSLEADEALIDLALAMIASETAPREEASLEMARLSTREEVFRQLNRSRDFALSSLGTKLSLDRLSAEACLSPFHFHRLHRQAFGETPHEFVTRARIARAARMLRADSEVGDVSLELGFESVPTFVRLFKGRTGMTPGAFRKIG